jgi:hypothetical protein
MQHHALACARLRPTLQRASLPSRYRQAVGARPHSDKELPRLAPAEDDLLSQRPLELDALGYFVLKIDVVASELVAEYYTNVINKDGELEVRLAQPRCALLPLSQPPPSGLPPWRRSGMRPRDGRSNPLHPGLCSPPFQSVQVRRLPIALVTARARQPSGSSAARPC